MNIFLRELRSSLKSLIIWSVIVVLFTVIGFSKFSAYEGNPDLLVILDSMPPALMDAMNFNAFNLTTVTGFFGVMFTYFVLILSIAAAMWGSDVITKEERDRTVEFALTLPVTRSRLVTGKLLAVLVDCIVLLLITWGAVMVGASQYETTNQEFYNFVNISMLALLVLQVIFLAVGIFLGCTMKQYKRASAVAIALLMGTYFLSIFYTLSDRLEFLKYFSPFTYFDPASLLHDLKLEPVSLVLSLGIIIAALVGGYLVYARRDLYI